MLQHKAVPLTVGHSTCGISKPFQINTEHQLVCATRRTLAQHFLAHVCTGQRHQWHVSTPCPNSLNNIVAPQLSLDQPQPRCFQLHTASTDSSTRCLLANPALHACIWYARTACVARTSMHMAVTTPAGTQLGNVPHKRQ
jgi:hypothetical protein